MTVNEGLLAKDNEVKLQKETLQEDAQHNVHEKNQLTEDNKPPLDRTPDDEKPANERKGRGADTVGSSGPDDSQARASLDKPEAPRESENPPSTNVTFLQDFAVCLKDKNLDQAASMLRDVTVGQADQLVPVLDKLLQEDGADEQSDSLFAKLLEREPFSAQGAARMTFACARQGKEALGKRLVSGGKEYKAEAVADELSRCFEACNMTDDVRQQVQKFYHSNWPSVGQICRDVNDQAHGVTQAKDQDKQHGNAPGNDKERAGQGAF